ncbi:unnamed protein product [Orchesella dallaii]|uniref:phenylalanine--tRNA ligase n=1 Tax=Orchesella dallaii TaxID=48710 RepID=A0ABP1RTH1_9HEXA
MALLTDKVLQHLHKYGAVDTLQLAETLKEEHQKVIGSVKSLQSLGNIIEVEQASRTKTELTAEGKSFVENGSHEAIVFAAIPEGGISQSYLMKAVGSIGKIGMSKAIQNGWIKIVKEEGGTKVVKIVDSVDDSIRNKLKDVLASGTASHLDAKALADLKKRKLLIQTPVVYYNIKQGSDFTTQLVKLETELTPEMLASGLWKEKNFKPYNFQALGTTLPSGHLHPLLKVRSEVRSILLEMGFSEMPTNRFVESSFWNFDALYVPQKHPARDAQDTFFLSHPEKCNFIPKEFMERVKAAHTGKEFGTLGYGPGWKEEEAYKNCMRTHTTAVSARMLHEIGDKGEFQPARLFSIDRVYRNETLDATHLAEFHQVEGVVADYNLNLGNLIGIMKEFFGRLGIKKLRFKPAYNPYTEPSMEVFSFHEGLKKWVEVGNSGMFRPEMLLPMGIPKDVRVIAWGLSLERPTMIRYGIDNIRDLVGPKVDLQMVYNNPICRLDTN